MASELEVPGSTPDLVADSVPERETSLDLGADVETETAATDPIPDTITIHILCPTLSATSRFTLNMSLDSTVAILRLRIQEIVPSHPEPIHQTLIVRGRRLHSHADSNILREALAPITGNEMTIHLLLPIIAPATPLQSRRFGSTAPFTNGSHSGSDETRTATNTLGHDVGNGVNDGDQSSNPISELERMYLNSLPSGNDFRGPSFARDPTLPSLAELDSHFQRLSNQIRIAQAAIASSADIATQTRNRFLHDYGRISGREFRRLNELNRSNPLNGPPSSYDTATLIMTRNGPPGQDPAAYTVITSNGSRYLALPPGSEHMRPLAPGSPPILRSHHLFAAQNNVAGNTETPNAGPPGQAPPTAGPNGAPDRGGPDGIVALPRDAAQHVVFNNRPRPRAQAAEGDAGGALRRIWLFIRLYFFIYMITEPGTWTRTLFVTMAVVVALASSSDITRQVYRMTVGPIQRHIERLALAGGPGEQPVAATAENGNNQPAPAQNAPDDIWQYLWRAERSLVLLLASLIPGIGERQVQARNAAEAEAERQRQERERERQQQEEEVPAPDGDRTQT